MEHFLHVRNFFSRLFTDLFKFWDRVLNDYLEKEQARKRTLPSTDQSSVTPSESDKPLDDLELSSANYVPRFQSKKIEFHDPIQAPVETQESEWVRYLGELKKNVDQNSPKFFHRIFFHRIFFDENLNFGRKSKICSKI